VEPSYPALDQLEGSFATGNLQAGEIAWKALRSPLLAHAEG
jgi:hypothetical protein